MPRLGPVPPAPPPIDPFKNAAPAPLGVVPSAQVSAVQIAAPKIGVANLRPSQVVSVAPEAQVPIGVVRPAIAAPPPPPAAPAPLGTVQDETPVYPPVAQAPKPSLGTIVDLSINRSPKGPSIVGKGVHMGGIGVAALCKGLNFRFAGTDHLAYAVTIFLDDASEGDAGPP